MLSDFPIRLGFRHTRVWLRRLLKKNISMMLVAVACFIFFGIIAWCWVLWTPTLDVSVSQTRSFDIVSGTENAQFQGFIGFLCAFLAAGFCISLWVFYTCRPTVMMLLWVTVVTYIASWWSLVFADFLFPLVRDVHRHGDMIVAGTIIHVMTTVQPGIILASAPAAAILTYWLLIICYDRSCVRAESCA